MNDRINKDSQNTQINRIINKNNLSIIQYLNKEFPNNKFNFPILSNVKKFHHEFLSNILNRISLNNSNCDYYFFKKTLNFIKNNDIIITQADKYVGICICDSKIYYDLCFKHLEDRFTYTPIDYNPHFYLFNLCKCKLINLNANSHISDSLFNKLYSTITSFINIYNKFI